MILISHRGNLTGPNKKWENNPEYIRKALDDGYNVEIDVWYENSTFYLGHDEPTHKINVNFLRNNMMYKSFYRKRHGIFNGKRASVFTRKV